MIIPPPDRFGGLKSGAKWGAAIGGGLGFFGGGLFGAIPGALLGAAGGAVVGGLKDLFSPSYRDIQTAYNPALLAYPNALPYSYSGQAMPNGLFGPSAAPLYPQSYAPYQNAFVMQEQPRGPGFGTGLLAGLGLGAFALPTFGLGMPWMMSSMMMPAMMGMYGMGMYGMGLGMGGFNWFAW